ncbi:MAG: hypothetical protein ACRYFZ_12885 [Janthinobacterium lividum]
MGLFSNLSFLKRSQPEPAASSAAEAEVAAVAPEAAPLPEAEPLARSAEVRAQADELVRRVAQELPTFITIAVVEAATGKILAGQWAGHSGGAVEVALANAEIVRQTHLAIEALQLTDTEQLADILVTLRYELHLLRVLPQAEWLLYLAVRTQDTNAALARAVVQQIDN